MLSSLSQDKGQGVLGDITLKQEQFNSPVKSNDSNHLMAHLDSLVAAESQTQKISPSKQQKLENPDGFQFRLTQISQKGAYHQSPKKQNVLSLESQIERLNDFIESQKLILPERLNRADDNGRKEILADFFKMLQEHSPKQNFGSPIKKAARSSPVKSPQKKMRNDENASPEKYLSPVKKSSSNSPVKDAQGASQKESRMSQRRRQKMLQEEAESDSTQAQQIYLQAPVDENTKASCPKSPVKRMKKMEEKENLENQENIEATYRKSPTKVIIGDETDASPMSESPKASEVEQESEGETKPFSTEAPKSLLSAKNQTPQQTELQIENQVVPITDIIEVDSNVINYGQFICGKILGSTLVLTNLSDQDQIVTMSISKSKSYNCDQIFGAYNREELPFEYKDGSYIKNAEIEFNCWFIENPVSKELQKNITMKIGPQMSQEFIIVVKAPKNRLQARIVSFIDIEMTEDQFGNKTSMALEKHVHHTSMNVRHKNTRKMDVLLLGQLDNPRIKCMKQLFNQNANTEVIQLAVKKTQGIQKFKLPFKNLSNYLESDVEFAFIRTQQQPFQEIIECLSFYCQPNQLKIASEQIQILTVQVKVNTEMLDKVDSKLHTQPLNKLLVARLKNSQVLFSFFVSITLVE